MNNPLRHQNLGPSRDVVAPHLALGDGLPPGDPDRREEAEHLPEDPRQEDEPTQVGRRRGGLGRDPSELGPRGAIDLGVPRQRRSRL